MCANPTVRKLSFTGSTEVGRLLMKQVAPTIKKISLELGGNAPFIVFDDADLDAAAEGAIISKYRNAGQTCVCANRFFVHDKVYDAFAAKLARGSQRSRSAAAPRRGVTQGPLINADAVAKVEEHLADAKARGAKVATGGKRHALGGTFYEPTVLTGVTPEMQIFREETFGPVAPLIPLQGRRRSRRAREPDRVRPRLLLLQPRHRPHLARRRSARIRDGRRQHRPHHHRGRAVRRHEAVRARPRRLRSTASRNSSRSSTSASAASTGRPLPARVAIGAPDQAERPRLRGE